MTASVSDEALLIIWECGPTHAAALAVRLNIPPKRASDILSRLHAEGWVKRERKRFDAQCLRYSWVYEKNDVS